MLSFEEQMKEIEKIVTLLENGSLTLDESIAKYREGAELVALCQKKLDEATYEIEEIRETMKASNTTDMDI